MLSQLIKHVETANPDPANRLMLLYLTGDVAEWRHKRSQSIEGCSVKLRSCIAPCSLASIVRFSPTATYLNV